MFMAGLSAACAVMALYFSITREGSSVLVISPIVSCNPLVTLILARLFLRRSENVTRELAIGTLMAVGGVALVVIGGNSVAFYSWCNLTNSPHIRWCEKSKWQ